MEEYSAVKARARIKVLDPLAELGAHSDVVRAAQELVELALEGMLRRIGIDPTTPAGVNEGGFGLTGAALPHHRDV